MQQRPVNHETLTSSIYWSLSCMKSCQVTEMSKNKDDACRFEAAPLGSCTSSCKCAAVVGNERGIHVLMSAWNEFLMLRERRNPVLPMSFPQPPMQRLTCGQTLRELWHQAQQCFNKALFIKCVLLHTVFSKSIAVPCRGLTTQAALKKPTSLT